MDLSNMAVLAGGPPGVTGIYSQVNPVSSSFLPCQSYSKHQVKSLTRTDSGFVSQYSTCDFICDIENSKDNTTVSDFLSKTSSTRISQSQGSLRKDACSSAIHRRVSDFLEITHDTSITATCSSPLLTKASSMRPTLDGSWCWDVTTSRMDDSESLCMDLTVNPFGSFRQNGSFPESLLEYTSQDSTDHQMEAPANSMVDDGIHDDSTHIYMNLLDRSDIDMIKNTRFWNDSVSSGSSSSGYIPQDATFDSNSDSGSSLSLIRDSRGLDHSEDEVDVDLTMYARPECEGSEDSAISSMQPTSSSSDIYSRFPVVTKPSASVSAYSKVQPWLEEVTASARSTHHKSSRRSSRGSRQAEFSYSTMYMSSDCDSSVGSFHCSQRHPARTSTMLPLIPETRVSDDYSISVRGNSKSHHSLHLQDDSVLQSTAPVEHAQAPKRHHNHSIDSDATFFMENPLVAHGVAGTKLSESKRRLIARKLKQVGKLMHKPSSSKSSLKTLAFV